MYHDAIIVLGTKIMPDGQPTPELVKRAQAAANLWKNGYAPMVIACGAQMDGEPCPEAALICAMLEEMGLPPHVLRADTLSRNTLQNVQNAKEILSSWGGSSVILVTGDYHVHRALAACRSIGLKATAHAVKTPGGPSRIKVWLREMLGWVEFKLGWQVKRPVLIQRLLEKPNGNDDHDA